MTYHYSRPNSVYSQTQSHQLRSQTQPSSRPYSVVGYEGTSSSRPCSVVGYEGISALQQQSSFRVIRRRQQRKNVRSNVLNPTLDNFYNILRRTEADLNVKSAKNWLKEYEGYRRQVINAEKSSIENTRPVSCYTPSFVSSPTSMEYQRYSMQF